VHETIDAGRTHVAFRKAPAAGCPGGSEVAARLVEDGLPSAPEPLCEPVSGRARSQIGEVVVSAV
jgi:hypothetical protein